VGKKNVGKGGPQRKEKPGKKRGVVGGGEEKSTGWRRSGDVKGYIGSRRESWKVQGAVKGEGRFLQGGEEVCRIRQGEERGKQVERTVRQK